MFVLPDPVRAMALGFLGVEDLAAFRCAAKAHVAARARYTSLYISNPRILEACQPRALTSVGLASADLLRLLDSGGNEVETLTLRNDYASLDLLQRFTRLTRLTVSHCNFTSMPRRDSLPCLLELEMRFAEPGCASLLRAAPNLRRVRTDLQAETMAALSELPFLAWLSVTVRPRQAPGDIQFGRFLALKHLSWKGYYLVLTSRPPLLESLEVDRTVMGEVGPLRCLILNGARREWAAPLTVEKLTVLWALHVPGPLSSLVLLREVSLATSDAEVISVVLALPRLELMLLRAYADTISLDIDFTQWAACASLERASFSGFEVSSALATALGKGGPASLRQLDFVNCITDFAWSADTRSLSIQ